VCNINSNKSFFYISAASPTRVTANFTKLHYTFISFCRLRHCSLW